MRLFNRPSRDDLYEKSLREKDRLIEALAEQIDYLRAQLGRPSWSSPLGADKGHTGVMVDPMSALPKEYSGPTHLVPPLALSHEYAEDIQHLLETGQLDAADAASAIAVLQAQDALLSDYDPQ
jgi:hypothetical protein